MDNRASIAGFLADIDEMTPGGFALGMHIGFSGPTFLFQTFPHQWVETYRDQGLQLVDPAVRWGFQNTGAIRWRELDDDDPKDVMGKAREHGLKYGVTIALVDGGSRTVGGCARADRDYLDTEIDAITGKALALHRATAGLSVLNEKDMEALTRMSIRLSHA